MSRVQLSRVGQSPFLPSPLSQGAKPQLPRTIIASNGPSTPTSLNSSRSTNPLLPNAAKPKESSDSAYGITLLARKVEEKPKGSDETGSARSEKLSPGLREGVVNLIRRQPFPSETDSYHPVQHFSSSDQNPDPQRQAQVTLIKNPSRNAAEAAKNQSGHSIRAQLLFSEFTNPSPVRAPSEPPSILPAKEEKSDLRSQVPVFFPSSHSEDPRVASLQEEVLVLRQRVSELELSLNSKESQLLESAMANSQLQEQIFQLKSVQAQFESQASLRKQQIDFKNDENRPELEREFQAKVSVGGPNAIHKQSEMFRDYHLEGKRSSLRIASPWEVRDSTPLAASQEVKDQPSQHIDHLTRDQPNSPERNHALCHPLPRESSSRFSENPMTSSQLNSEVERKWFQIPQPNPDAAQEDRDHTSRRGNFERRDQPAPGRFREEGEDRLRDGLRQPIQAQPLPKELTGDDIRSISASGFSPPRQSTQLVLTEEGLRGSTPSPMGVQNIAGKSQPGPLQYSRNLESDV